MNQTSDSTLGNVIPSSRALCFLFCSQKEREKPVSFLKMPYFCFPLFFGLFVFFNTTAQMSVIHHLKWCISFSGKLFYLSLSHITRLSTVCVTAQHFKKCPTFTLSFKCKLVAHRVEAEIFWFLDTGPLHYAKQKC